MIDWIGFFACPWCLLNWIHLYPMWRRLHSLLLGNVPIFHHFLEYSWFVQIYMQYHTETCTCILMFPCNGCIIIGIDPMVLQDIHSICAFHFKQKIYWQNNAFHLWSYPLLAPKWGSLDLQPFDFLVFVTLWTYWQPAWILFWVL